MKPTLYNLFLKEKPKYTWFKGFAGSIYYNDSIGNFSKKLKKNAMEQNC